MTYDRATTQLLTASDERRLANQIEKGRAAAERLGRDEGLAGDEQARARGERARRHFMEANLRLVLSIASKFRAPDHVDRQDMIQDGMIGLERAVEKFDGRKGYKFSTYATWWIRQSIQRGLENTASTIRVPSERTIALNHALGEVDGDFDRLPAKLALLASTANVTSLDRSALDGDGTLGDTLADLATGPEALALDAAGRVAVRRMLDRLDPFDRQVVERRFGLDGRGGATFSQISAEVGIGAEAARRRVLRVLRDLRESAHQLAA